MTQHETKNKLKTGLEYLRERSRRLHSAHSSRAFPFQNAGVSSLSETSFPATTIIDGTLDLSAPHVSVMNLQFARGHLQVGNTVTLDYLNVTGGSVNFDTLIVRKKLTVSGGTLTVKTITYTNDVLAIAGSGAVNLSGGTLGAVTVASSSDSTFGTDMTSLTVQAGDTGTVNLSGGTLGKLSQQAGTLSVTGDVTVQAMDLSAGTMKISGTLQLSGSSMSVSKNAALELDGGTLIIEQAGTYSVNGSFTMSHESGSTVDFANSGGEIIVKNGMSVGPLTVKGDGTLALNGFITGWHDEDRINVIAGATLSLADDEHVEPPIILGAGGCVSFGNTFCAVATVKVDESVSKGGATIAFRQSLLDDDRVVWVNVAIEDYRDGVKLDFKALKYADVTVQDAHYDNREMTIVYKVKGEDYTREIIIFNFSGPDLKDGEKFTVISDGAGGTEFETCFLSGTRILTPDGWRVVEALMPGDLVITFKNGEEVATPVRWVGEGEAVCRPDLPDDLSGYAVRIARGAFGGDIPFEDILLTSEHCVFVDGGLIPVRMLVNGENITYERALPFYRFHHIETEKHAIISAAGLLTETYLDTGNRARFREGMGVVPLKPKRADDLAAPLRVRRAEVEPVYHRLSENRLCPERPLARPRPTCAARPLTLDAALRLVLPGGEEIFPLSRRQDGYVFKVPRYIEKFHIVSRASRPCDVIGPFIDDRRMLGVLIGEIHLIEARRMTRITRHLTDHGEGWHDVEHPAARWTNGRAVLTLSECLTDLKSDALLFIQILQQGPYLTQTTPELSGLIIAAA